ncbi:hypothetical protein C8Q74DRAFT_1360230 [Fomes fomentarius]|nr:hypothetical protein C8Q74DRAFT_1360230 [Fomes fomentarius]
MSSPTLVDDTNYVVQYAPGWIWDQFVLGEVDNTRHGAAITGLTASLGFTGIGIDVVGTLEPTETYGRPTTSYSIDGKIVGNYTAPFTPSGGSILNVTFFSKRDLSSGNHQIVVTNVNGTNPNTFWLDYFLVYGPGASDVSTSGPSPTTVTSGDPRNTASVDGTTGTSSAPVNTNVPPGSVSTTSTSSSINTGAIVGGVIGGLAMLVLCGILVLLWRRRNPKVHQAIEPFAHTPVRSSLSPKGSSSNPSTASPHPGQRTLSEVTYASSVIVSSLPASVISPATNHTAPSDVASTHRTDLATVGIAVASSPTTDSVPSPPVLALAQSKSFDSSRGSGPSTPRSGLVFPSDSQVVSSPTESSSIPPTPTPLVHDEISRAPWYVPAAAQSRAQSLLRAFSMRNRSQDSRAQIRTPARDVDSGMRLYNEASLPPAYTPD